MKEYLIEILKRRVNQYFARAKGLAEGVVIPVAEWDNEDYWSQEAIYAVNVQRAIKDNTLS